ncbi:PhoH family protein [Flavonifractor plautii]|uniref:PhoH family protein n=1 Tax=Flavonifractor plautii TaxID=292800 RepID=UPI0018AA9885|nr:PhoH family protein [Flavonifractor plautii]
MTEYFGFREVPMSDEALAAFYQDKGSIDQTGWLANEYLIIENTDGIPVDQFRWDGQEFVHVPFKVINSRFMGKVKPRNIQQQLAVDMLYNSDITVKILVGKFGTGKDYLMSSAAIDLIEKGKYEKIVWVRNNIEVKNSKPIGHLPGDYKEKLLPFAMPLADHVGGVDSLEIMIGQGKVEIVHLGFIRGRDIKNSIIMCSEAENMTKEHIQLLLGRVGEGSSLWINGDYKQVDAPVFRENNGLMIAVDKLKGHPRFGFVKLLKTERSETAAMADLLD